MQQKRMHSSWNFFTELSDSGLQHRTINVVRSAVSMTHEKMEGVPIGKILWVKGVYILGLPKPPHTYTWDVDMVTQLVGTPAYP